MRNLKPKKYLGQNFLTNKNVVNKIIEAAKITKKDIVLEIGPGKGILTQSLIQKAKKVIAVEKDNELVQYLTDNFKKNKNFKLIEGDILKINLDTLFSLKKINYKIVANIPYCITSYFLRKFLQSTNQPKSMTLMIQREVAERIIAKNKKESILSISVKAYGQPKIIAIVSAGNFFPKPKVDSAVISIEDISKNFFKKNINNKKIKEEEFFNLVKLGFGHKRKILKNNLRLEKEIMQKCEISQLNRAEDLSLEQWRCLSATT